MALVVKIFEVQERLMAQKLKFLVKKRPTSLKKELKVQHSVTSSYQSCFSPLKILPIAGAGYHKSMLDFFMIIIMAQMPVEHANSCL